MPDRLETALRVGAFAVVAFTVLVLVGSLLPGLDAVTRSAIASLCAGLAANFLLAARFERGVPADFGFAWTARSGRQWVAGFGLGAGAVAAAVAIAVAAGWASYAQDSYDWTPASIVAVLLAGAVGEELVFRGYAFQYLARVWSAPGTVLCSGALFGAAHWLSNPNIAPAGALNTALWGCLLGYACTRTGALWLPAGLHLGWNLALALFTSNLSGLTIKASGWALRWSASERWSGGPYGLEGGLLTTFLAAVVFGLVRRMR